MKDHMRLDSIICDQNGNRLTAEDLLELMRSWTITLDELCEAYYEARKWINAHEALRMYHMKRLELLEDLFEFKLTKFPGRLRRNSRDYDAVVRIAHKTLEEATRLSKGPFSIYLEGGPGPLEAEMHKKHSRRISKRVSSLRAAYMGLLKDALLALDHTLKDKTFNEAQLVESGLPIEKPDPDDYW